MVTPVEIGNRRVGPDQPCFIIAEAGVNHNGDLEMGRRLVDAAAAAGADAVKFQTFRAERLIIRKAPKAAYQLQTTDPEESQLEMLHKLELSEQAHGELASHCQKKGILFLSTPFEEESADFLEALGLPAFKIPSGELTNLPFLIHVARKGRPMIVSTGMSTLDEVEAAVKAIRGSGNSKLILLHCVSNYPANPEDVNLRVLSTLMETFQVPVGYSDHTTGIDISLGAVALGASIIEKHLTLDRNLPGPDHRASLEPAELTALVTGIRRVESALGHGKKVPANGEITISAVARKSLVAARDLPAGTVLSPSDVAVKRPGTGIPPKDLNRVLGMKIHRTLSCDELLCWEDLK